MKLKIEFMRLAIEEARRSKQEKKPPLYVGAVVVKDGNVLDVAHRGEIAQGDHAEYTLLERKLKDVDLTGATLYTTLEPCTTRNHPKVPCAVRIVQRRLGKVVIGIVDPNPDISGKGIWILKDANIEVEHFPAELQKEIEEMNKEFIKEQREEKKEVSKQGEEARIMQEIKVTKSTRVNITQVAGDMIVYEKEKLKPPDDELFKKLKERYEKDLKESL